MDLDRLETLATELFVDNIRRVSGKWVSPLNIDSVRGEISAVEERKKEVEREIYSSLASVEEAIDSDGGISEETYNAHRFAINSLARDLTDQRWWGSGLDHLCEAEDREAKKANPEQVERYPDGKYGSIAGDNHENICDEGSKVSGFEGTLFQTDYDANGNLVTYRIFHQGHRNSLKVTSVETSVLIDRIRSHVNEFRDEPLDTGFGLTLDKEAYLQKIEEFNAEFGDFFRIGVVENERRTVFIELNENPEELANRFVELGKAQGRDFTADMGTVSYSLSDGHSEYNFLDLYLPSHISGSGQRAQFDPVRDKDSSTVILPNSVHSSFLISLLKMYASQSE